MTVLEAIIPTKQESLKAIGEHKYNNLDEVFDTAAEDETKAKPVDEASTVLLPF